MTVRAMNLIPICMLLSLPAFPIAAAADSPSVLMEEPSEGAVTDGEQVRIQGTKAYKYIQSRCEEIKRVPTRDEFDSWVTALQASHNVSKEYAVATGLAALAVYSAKRGQTYEYEERFGNYLADEKGAPQSSEKADSDEEESCH